jgi:hypothetical protein
MTPKPFIILLTNLYYLQCRTIKNNNFLSTGLRFFQGKQAPELYSERQNIFKNALFKKFTHFLGLDNFLNQNFHIQCAPFRVNLYLEQP